MYRISILTDHKESGMDYARQVRRFCAEKTHFPKIEVYTDREAFFSHIMRTSPSVIILTLPGVSGLNAAERIRSLLPDCGFIWCSDLDFSLHAYKLRADYFILSPVSESSLHEGLSAWMENTGQLSSFHTYHKTQTGYSSI